MRSALVTLLLLAAGGLITPQANASSHDAFDPEGVVMPFAAGDQFSWQIPSDPEDKIILFISSFAQGADVDLSKAGTAAPAPIEHMRPNEVSGIHFIQANGDARTVKILNGTGLITIVRNDLASNIPIDRPASHSFVDLALSPGECRGYVYTLFRMTHPALLQGKGQGASFSIFSSNLTLLTSSRDEARWTFDPDKASGGFIQACNPSTAGTLTARLEGLYPAPSPPPKDTPAYRPTPIGGPPLALATLALAALLARRRPNP